MEREYWVSLKDKNASGEVKQVAYVSPILKETGINRKESFLRSQAVQR